MKKSAVLLSAALFAYAGFAGAGNTVETRNHGIPFLSGLIKNFFHGSKKQVQADEGSGRSSFYLVLPSYARTGEDVPLRVAVIDKKSYVGFPDNQRTFYHGNVAFESTDSEAVLPAVYQFQTQEMSVHTFYVRFNSTGPQSVSAYAPVDTMVRGLSNSVYICSEEPENRIFWGDIHGHSCYSDGVFNSDNYFEHARDFSFLDFAALTDHGDDQKIPYGRGFMNDAEWELVKQSVTKFSESGRFIAFPGFEWTSNTYGHRHVVYRDNDGAIFDSEKEEYNEPFELFNALHGKNAIVIPHHPNHGHDPTWHDPSVERLVEIYSKHGCSETCPHPMWPMDCGMWSPVYTPVQDILALNHRLGLTASGDSHDGYPGLIAGGPDDGSGCEGISRVPVNYSRGGPVAVICKSLSREDVFDALYNRRCYATTGPRIIIDFSINGMIMGSELKTTAVPLIKIHFQDSTRPLRVELVKNNLVIKTWIPGSCSESYTFEDSEFPYSGGSFKSIHYYYVRIIIEENSEIAWSSPVWVDWGECQPQH